MVQPFEPPHIAAPNDCAAAAAAAAAIGGGADGSAVAGCASKIR